MRKKRDRELARETESEQDMREREGERDRERKRERSTNLQVLDLHLPQVGLNLGECLVGLLGLSLRLFRFGLRRLEVIPKMINSLIRLSVITEQTCFQYSLKCAISYLNKAPFYRHKKALFDQISYN